MASAPIPVALEALWLLATFYVLWACYASVHLILTTTHFTEGKTEAQEQSDLLAWSVGH